MLKGVNLAASSEFLPTIMWSDLLPTTGNPTWWLSGGWLWSDNVPSAHKCCATSETKSTPCERREDVSRRHDTSQPHLYLAGASTSPAPSQSHWRYCILAQPQRQGSDAAATMPALTYCQRRPWSREKLLSPSFFASHFEHGGEACLAGTRDATMRVRWMKMMYVAGSKRPIELTTRSHRRRCFLPV